MHATPMDSGTRDRLLRAAAEVFAKRGFDAATVREICKAAGANVAAVNYHFGGKDRLYAAVLTQYKQRCQERYPLDMGLGPSPTPEERLLAFIRAMLLRMAGDGDPLFAAHDKLLTMEIMNPTQALDPLFDDYMRPCAAYLHQTLQEFLGSEAPEDVVRDCMGGVISQCVFFLQHRSIIVRAYPEVTYDEEGLERIAHSILRFSLHGVYGMRREMEKTAKPAR